MRTARFERDSSEKYKFTIFPLESFPHFPPLPSLTLSLPICRISVCVHVEKLRKVVFCLYEGSFYVSVFALSCCNCFPFPLLSSLSCIPTMQRILPTNLRPSLVRPRFRSITESLRSTSTVRFSFSLFPSLFFNTHTSSLSKMVKHITVKLDGQILAQAEESKTQSVEGNLCVFSLSLIAGNRSRY